MPAFPCRANVLSHLSRSVARWDQRGRNSPGVGSLWGRRMAAGVPKSPNNVTSAFFNRVHFLPKDLSFEHDCAKLASCPGRHLTALRPCIQDTLSHQDDIILKVERIWIPTALRNDLKRQLHSAHLGLTSIMGWEGDTIFCLGMRHDIQQLAGNCHICQATNRSHCTSMRRVASLGRKWVLTYMNSVANRIWSLLISS